MIIISTKEILEITNQIGKIIILKIEEIMIIEIIQKIIILKEITLKITIILKIIIKIIILDKIEIIILIEDHLMKKESKKI